MKTKLMYELHSNESTVYDVEFSRVKIEKSLALAKKENPEVKWFVQVWKLMEVIK